MCGITGILGRWDLQKRRRPVERLTGARFHRGPDTEGCFDDDLATSGFRQLVAFDALVPFLETVRR